MQNSQWEVRIRKDVSNIMNKFPKKDVDKISLVITEMGSNPYHGDIKKMKDRDDIWRRRVGNYRIFYKLLFEENIVYIFNIERRNSKTY